MHSPSNKRPIDLDSAVTMLLPDDPSFPDPCPDDEASASSSPRVTRRANGKSRRITPEDATETSTSVTPDQETLLESLVAQDRAAMEQSSTQIQTLNTELERLVDEHREQQDKIQRHVNNQKKVQASLDEVTAQLREALTKEVTMEQIQAFVAFVGAIPPEMGKKLLPKVLNRTGKLNAVSALCATEQEKSRSTVLLIEHKKNEAAALSAGVAAAEARAGAVTAALQALKAAKTPAFGACVACMSNPATHVMPGCAHLCLCEQCVFTLMNPDPEWEPDEVEELLDQRQRCPCCRAGFNGESPKKVICP